MAWWDREADTVWLQVVYDGLAGAGKSTSLRALAEHFSQVREGEVYNPAPTARQTTYFDCLQLRGGLTSYHRTRVQVLSVPGQVVWSERRWTVLSYADAVVLVCDATASLAQSELALRFLREASPTPPAPFVVQANKTDRPSARSSDELAAALGLDPSLVYAASAQTQQGVVQALLAAITLARLRTEETVRSGGLEALRPGEPDPEALLAELMAKDDGHSADDSLEQRERVLSQWAERPKDE